MLGLSLPRYTEHDFNATSSCDIVGHTAMLLEWAYEHDDNCCWRKICKMTSCLCVCKG
jgi:hypothetical protein